MTNPDINQLIIKHTATLQANGAEVIAALEQSPPDVVRAQSVAHMIKGAAGSIGFEDYSEVARALEGHLKIVIAENASADETTFQLLEEFKAVQAVLEPTDSVLFSANS